MKTFWRKLALVAFDLVVITGAYMAAFALRAGETPYPSKVVIRTLPFLLGISILVHLRLGLFNAILRFASIYTAIAIVKAVVYSILLTSLTLSLTGVDRVRPGVLTIYGMMALLILGASRLVVRLLENHRRTTGKERRVLLYGANEIADLVLRSRRSLHDAGYAAVGIVDEGASKKGQHIHGVEVLGGIKDVQIVGSAVAADELWVCVSGLPGEQLRSLYAWAAPLHLRVKVLPRLDQALMGSDINRFHEVEISDLLRRPTRRLDLDGMQKWVQNRRVLITGAGGSIGSELARQVSRLGPRSLALCDCGEPGLFEIHRELHPKFGKMILDPYLVNVCDESSVGRMFAEVTPDIVFHAAAFKHVPLVELNPCEGIINNVQGMANVSAAAIEHGTKSFVFISTDKAVRPVNVMGATKRIGEQICQVLNREGDTRFMVVRFGNVLGSSGSVIPIFQEQIRCGGSVTVTHPDMTRFFMLISEAVELVIQAGSIGKGGEIFLLDMGKPIRIAQMAEDLIRLMGREPGHDVQIVFTGVRPGEKIHEELLHSDKDARTSFPDIWIDHDSATTSDREAHEAALRALLDAARRGDRRQALLGLKRLVSAFTPSYEANLRLLGATDDEPASAVKPETAPLLLPSEKIASQRP